MCNSGKRQSPINIDPATLLFDPDLRAIKMDDHRVSGILENNGHSIIFRIQDETGSYHSISSMDEAPAAAALLSSSSSSSLLRPSELHSLRQASSSASSSSSLSSPSPDSSLSASSSSTSPPAVVSVTGGPFSYTYHIDSIYLHFGRTDLHGSEHVVAGVSFPAEVCTHLILPLSFFSAPCRRTVHPVPPLASALPVIGLLLTPS